MPYNRCNRCSLRDVGKLARIQAGFVVIQLRDRDRPLQYVPGDDHQADHNWIDHGYDVFILRPGEEPNWVMWLPVLPATCAC
jgi:hypothetical protein